MYYQKLGPFWFIGFGLEMEYQEFGALRLPTVKIRHQKDCRRHLPFQSRSTVEYDEYSTSVLAFGHRNSSYLSTLATGS